MGRLRGIRGRTGKSPTGRYSCQEGVIGRVGRVSGSGWVKRC